VLSGYVGTGYSQLEQDFTAATLTKQIITGFTNQPYSQVEQDFTASVFTRQIISGYAGTGYSQVEQDFSGSTVTKQIITGYANQPYTQIEQDFTAGAIGKQIISGYAGTGYSQVEQDFSGTVVTKQIISGYTNLPYTQIEQDFTAGAITKQIISGYTGTGYSQLEQNIIAGSYVSYSLDNLDGTHTSYLLADNYAFAANINETLYTNGHAATLDYKAGFGHDTISGFKSFSNYGAAHDLLDLFGSGFTTSAQALALVKSDGLGNTIVSMNDAGSDTIKLLGIAPGSLTASDFKIA